MVTRIRSLKSGNMAEVPSLWGGKEPNAKILALLSYLSLLCIIPLFLKRDDDFLLYHGKQGLVLFMAEVTIFVAHIVFGLWILRAGFFLLGVFSIWGMVGVIKGQRVHLPLVSKIAGQIVL